MKRTEYTATIIDDAGTVIGRRTTYARNSANDAGHAMLRDLRGAERCTTTWDAARKVCTTTWRLTVGYAMVTMIVAPTADHPHA